MKRFIIYIIFFSLIYFLLQIIFIGRFVAHHQFRPSKMYYSSEFDSAFKERNSEIIAIGNSKLLSSIDKEVLEEQLKFKTSILGYSSSNISVSRLTLEAYLHNCITKPKIVLLEVSWFTFNKDRTTFHTITGDLVLEDPFLLKYLFRYSPRFWDNFKETLKQQKRKQIDSLNINYSSRFGEKKPLSKDYTFKYKDFEVVFPTHNAGIENLLLEDFYKIVELCKDNNILLILYTAPEDEEYSLAQKDRKTIMNIFYNISSKEEQIIYLDYTLGGKYYNKQFELWLQNSHHINENDLFTKKLTDDVKNIIQYQSLYH